MSYDSDVAALSVWDYLKMDEASGSTLADSSGNARNFSITGSPTFAQTGPGGGADSISWGNVANQHAESVATTTAGAFTHLIWVKLPSNPAANIGVQTRAIAYNTVGAADGRLFIDSAGKPNFNVFSGATFTITGPSSIAGSGWTMLVASVGAAGMKLRANKTSLATNVGVTSAYTGASQKIFIRGGDSGYTGTGLIETSHSFYIESQLSNAQTDALYDSMLSIILAGERWLSTTSMLDGLALTAVKVPGDPFVNTTVMLDTTGFPIAVTGERFSSSSTALDGSPLVQVVVAGEAFPVGTVALDGHVQGAPLPGEAFESGVVALDGGVLAPSGTDTTNAFYGRQRGGTATVEVTVPVVEPIGVATTRVDKAVPLPLPVLVKGRPT